MLILVQHLNNEFSLFFQKYDIITMIYKYIYMLIIDITG